ncbi:MAG: PBP1A family penicillin-binding protein [Candidatus Levybacteria bacterium]|nr:PBP1A family penicillin-binding protein [Candidatus Levybacteria bacterium]
MKLVEDLIILAAKILIFIGDVTLLFLSLLWKILIHLRRKKIVEQIIFSTEEETKKPIVKLPRLPQFKLPVFKLPVVKMQQIKLSRPHLPKFHLKHKKRGRPRLPLRLPFQTRLKYILIGSIFSFFFIFMPIVSIIFIRSLPNPSTLAHQEISQTTKIYDRNKTLLYQIYANQDRTNVPLSKIPQDLKNATIAIEDKNFYKTPGFDVLAILRAAIVDLTGRPLQGGSTITQQLVKSRLLTPERTLERKIKEVILSVWAQRIYTKDQILEMYFNQVPYGGTAWGAQAAAQTYFGKDVTQLSLSESAFLAGLPQAPSTYSPYGQNPNLWNARQKEVLAQMVSLNFITSEQAKKAENEKLEFRENKNSIKAPHFVMYVRQLLIERYGLPIVERGGLSVITSLDLKTQDMAQKIVTAEVENSAYLNLTNAAALITNPKNGDILAMVGGKDYFAEDSGNYNVTTALRQPGSAIKVVTYSAALLNGFTAATTVQDTPVSYAPAGALVYSPVNYDGRFHGTVTLRNALGNSINIPAVKILNKIGIQTMVDLGKKMGITSWKDPQNYGLAITLGAAEVKMTDMAVVYGTLANQGEKIELNPILKVTNYQGQVFEEKKEIKKKRAVPEEVAFIISNILSDNNSRAMEFGYNSPLNIPRHTVSVKTGTTDNKRDNWTIGYTPNILTAVWVGNNNNSPMNPRLASGITGAAPIWNKIMNNLLSSSDPKDELLSPPKNIVVKPCGGKNEYFIKGTENRVLCRPISLSEQKPNP